MAFLGAPLTATATPTQSIVPERTATHPRFPSWRSRRRVARVVYSSKEGCCSIVVGMISLMIPSRSLSSSSSSPSSPTREHPRRCDRCVVVAGLNIHLVSSSHNPLATRGLHAYTPPAVLSSCAPRRAARNFASRTLVTHGERGWASARCLRTRGRVATPPLRCVALRCAMLRCVTSRRVASPVHERFTSARATVPFHPSSTSECDPRMRLFLFSPFLSAHPPATMVSRGHVDSLDSIHARYRCWWTLRLFSTPEYSATPLFAPLRSSQSFSFSLSSTTWLLLSFSLSFFFSRYLLAGLAPSFCLLFSSSVPRSVHFPRPFPYDDRGTRWAGRERG